MSSTCASCKAAQEAADAARVLGRSNAALRFVQESKYLGCNDLAVLIANVTTAHATVKQ